MTLACSYLPNENQLSTLIPYLTLLEQHKEGMVLLGDDLNLVLDPTLDASLGATHLSYSKLKKFESLLHEHQLIDSWRTLNPRDKDYTFFFSLQFVGCSQMRYVGDFH